MKQASVQIGPFTHYLQSPGKRQAERLAYRMMAEGRAAAWGKALSRGPRGGYVETWFTAWGELPEGTEGAE